MGYIDSWKNLIKNLTWNEVSTIANKICYLIYAHFLVLLLVIITGNVIHLYFTLKLLFLFDIIIMLALLLAYPFYWCHELLKLTIVFFLAWLQEKIRQ